MATQYYAIPTSTGNAIMANAFLLGQKVNVTTFILGDGGGGYYQPTADMTELRGEVWRGNVNSAEIDPADPNVINFTTIIPSDVGGFTVREMGIEDDRGRLIGVANTPEMQLVHFEDGVTAESEFVISIAFTHPQVLEWKVDPTIVIATKRDIVAHNDDEAAHPHLFAELSNKVNIETPNWINAELINGVTIRSGSLVRYRKDGNIIFLEGWVGNVTLGEAVFVLPEGFRSGQTIAFATLQSSQLNEQNTARLVVNANGNVYFDRSTKNLEDTGLSLFCSFSTL